MEAVRQASDALYRRLAMSLELVHALTGLSCEKEAHLTSGDIESLRAATEKEEEIIADLGKLEKDRELDAGALLNAIGIFGSGQSLMELIEAVPDPESRQRLTAVRTQLKEALDALESQNDKLRQLLDLQMGYTEYMLNLIYIPKSKHNTYNVQGSRTDNASQLSLMDLHV